MSARSEFGGKLSIAGELLVYLWRNKLWWMLPMVGVLLVFGLLIVFGTSTGVGPFIYTMF